MLVGLFLCISVEAKDLVLSGDNTLVLNSSFRGPSISKLMEEASEMDANLKSGYPIYLFMYTPGGSIQAGLELIEFLGGLNRPIHTVTLFSASMGFQTVQHLGQRYIMKYGVLMSHKARGSFYGEFGGGISQLDSRYQLWVRRMMLMDLQTVKRTKKKQTYKSYTTAYTPELWLNGQEAVDKGYADEVVTIKCDISLRGFKEKTERYGFFGIKIKWSKCPLKTSPVRIKGYLITNKGEMDLDKFLIENGKFGKDCREYASYASRKYRNDDDRWWKFRSSQEEEDLPISERKTDLCAADKTLTLKKINKKIEERQRFFTRNLRDHIEYSY